MPIVTVLQSPRDIERKRALVARITQAFVDAYEVRPEHVQVYIHEVKTEERRHRRRALLEKRYGERSRKQQTAADRSRLSRPLRPKSWIYRRFAT